MASAGELSHRVAFDRRPDVNPDEPDDLGNTQSEFVEQFVVSAKVLAKFGGETVTAARLTGRQPVNITVRQSSKTELIETDWRARDVRSGRIYDIRSITDPDDGGAWIELLTEYSGETVAVAPPASDAPSFDFSLAGNSMYLALLDECDGLSNLSGFDFSIAANSGNLLLLDEMDGA